MKKILAIIGYLTVIIGLLHEALNLVSSRLVSFSDYCKTQGISFEAGGGNKSGVSIDKIPKVDPVRDSTGKA